MAETKAKPTGASVDDHLAQRASPEQLGDCKTLMRMLQHITKEPPKMWGPSIVGYGSYTYRYESGRTGEACLTGFAVRGKELVIYLVAGTLEEQQLLAKLGKYKTGKACLYIKHLADVDTSVLEDLIVRSIEEAKRRHVVQGNA